jgi:uncharacterized membrane protein YkvA (DUF1232 family)
MALSDWARAVKRDLVVLWLAVRDPAVPWPAKALAGAALLYALSPIDLIPDVIPVLGQVDDLILVPLLIWGALRLIPSDQRAHLRDRAAREGLGRLPKSRAGAVVIVALWVLAAGAVVAILRV